jgi:hypothetical protein
MHLTNTVYEVFEGDSNKSTMLLYCTILRTYTDTLKFGVLHMHSENLVVDDTVDCFNLFFFFPIIFG